MVTIGNLEVSDACALVVDGADGGADLVVSLTAYELKVLDRLAAANGEVVSRADLQDALYGGDAPARDSNVLQVLIGRLRKKLAAASATARIETVHKQGYCIKADPA